MKFLFARNTIGDLKRFGLITGTIFEEGFGVLLQKAKLSWAVPLECKIRCYLKACVGMWSDSIPEEEFPTRLRKILIKLGPTFVKFGQVLSLRPDIIPSNLTTELSKLTNQVPPFPYQQVKILVENELGKPIEKLFKEFDHEPLAAASLAQVHKAILFDGTKVAVKVQRPGIRKMVGEDIDILRFLANRVEQQVPEWRVFRPKQLVEEFAQTIGRELDFTIEAVHAKRFGAMFAGEPSVKVAKVFSEYSSRSVMTMELINGVKLDDEKALQKARIDKQVLAQNGVNALLRQVFVDGFFHADPHPGNYFALPNNVFAFIDYGMVGRLSVTDRRELAAFFISFLNQDSESAIKHLWHLVEVGLNANKMSFEHDVDDILHEWFGAKLKDISLARTFMRIMDSGRRNHIYFPSSFAYLGKSLLTTEAMGMSLDPEFDFAKQMKPYAMQILKKEINPKNLKQKLQDTALDYYSYLEEGPEMILQTLKKVQNGQFEVKINQEEFEAFGKQLSEEGTKRMTTTLVASLFAIGLVSYLVANGLLNVHLNLSTVALVVLGLVGGWTIIKKLF